VGPPKGGRHSVVKNARIRRRRVPLQLSVSGHPRPTPGLRSTRNASSRCGWFC